ncbi:MAG: hypothetical protein ACI814_002889, partial [Mariniblastus sp.]
SGVGEANSRIRIHAKKQQTKRTRSDEIEFDDGNLRGTDRSDDWDFKRLGS